MRKAKEDIAAENARLRRRVGELEEELEELVSLEGFGDESLAAEPVGHPGVEEAARVYRQPISPAGLEEAWRRFMRPASALPTLLEDEPRASREHEGAAGSSNSLRLCAPPGPPDRKA